jgi:hypothetical protein
MPWKACLSGREARVEVSKAERLREIYRRLADAPAAATFAEMRSQLDDIVNAVEDQLTGIPHNPAHWRVDGRIYPPQPDTMRPVPAHPQVTRFRSLAHNTYIGANGAIEIVSLAGAVEFWKPGADGRGVWDQDTR